MTRLLIEHGSVLTMNDADDLIEDGALLIEDDRIVDVGTTADVRARHDLEGVRVIDATDKAVLPGLVDLHFHTAHRQGLVRPPAAVGVPGHLLVPDHPRPR